MPDPYVIFSFTLIGEPLVGDRPTSDIVGWFRGVVGGRISLPGVSCFELIGPEPQIQRRTTVNGVRITAGWLARVRMECFQTPRSAPAPDSPPVEDPAVVAAGVATAMTSFRESLRMIITGDLFWGGKFQSLQIASTAYAPIHGTVTDWSSGRMARTSSAQNTASLWRQLTGNEEAVIGYNPPPTPNALQAAGDSIQKIVIWGGIGVLALVAAPTIYRLVKTLDDPYDRRFRYR